MSELTITEFLLARVAEDEDVARTANVKQDDPEWWASLHMQGATVRSKRDNRPMSRVEYLPSDEDNSPCSTSIIDPHAVGHHIARHDPARVLADCEAKRRIIEWHRSWPVLVETQPTFTGPDPTDMNSMTYRMSQQIAWKTEQQYRETFGTEPPTGPVLRFMALPYADHPDYNPAWLDA